MTGGAVLLQVWPHLFLKRFVTLLHVGGWAQLTR
jgi:hypothetical protein